MKILRIFDSLKFMRAMFVALAAAFFFGCFSDFAFADTVKNLFDKDTYSTASGYYIDDGKVASSPQNNRTVVIDVKPNTTYSYWHAAGTGGGRSFATNGIVKIGDDAQWLNNKLTIARNAIQTITIPSNMNKLYICVGRRDTNLRDFEEQFADFMLVEGIPDSTDYVPFVPKQIKIATTKYNEAEFAPVETRLDAAVAAVDTVVTQTMTQAQAIDQIANEKQTRPDEGCSAKYCLLVEDEDGTPHWYPIAGANGVAHALPAGYTELQYIESTGTQYIDTGITGGAGLSVDMVVQGTGDRGIIFSFDQDYIGAYVGDNGTDFYGPGTFTGISSLVKTDITTYWESENSKLKQTTTINGVTKTSDKYSRTPGVIYLFRGFNWGEANSFWAGKMFSFLLKRNGVAIRNFIPAKNANNEIGMYDLADSNPATAFHVNAGTGEFIAGPDM